MKVEMEGGLWDWMDDGRNGRRVMVMDGLRYIFGRRVMGMDG